MPKVSVIIATYNRVELLSSSIKSVLNQTFEDFELIISDDSSTDNTKEYVEGLTDKRIIYINNETNRGVSATRNNALKSSTGNYIAFLDDDDEWLPEKLSLQIDKIEKSPSKVGAVYTGVMYFDMELGEVSYVSRPCCEGNILDDILPENILATSSLLLRKSCFEKVGLFDETISYAEDFDMWIRIAKYYNFSYVDKPLVRYGLHNSKITHDYKAVISGLQSILEKHNDLYSKNKIAYSKYQLKLGINLCYSGNTQKGREAIILAIKLYPFNLKHYYNLALSIFGARAYMKSKVYLSKFFSHIRYWVIQRKNL